MLGMADGERNMVCAGGMHAAGRACGKVGKTFRLSGLLQGVAFPSESSVIRWPYGSWLRGGYGMCVYTRGARNVHNMPTY